MNARIEEEAKQAALEGKKLDTNPYDPGTHQSLIWSMAWEMAVFCKQQREKVERKIKSIEKREAAFLSACGFDLSNGFFSDDVAHWRAKEPEVYRFFMDRAAV